jgi:F420-0:gamma-glutamyl ligase
MIRELATVSLKTRIFRPCEDLSAFVIEALKAHDRHPENAIIAVTSKIVSLAENERVAKSSIKKADLVRQQSDIFLGAVAYGCFLTIKHGLFIPSAGIDESNSEHDEYILYPRDPFASAVRLRKDLMAAFGAKNVGVLLTDSHTAPLRAGVTGVALGYAGFRGIHSMIGQKDLFGRTLQMTQVNVADAISAAAVVCMGEGAECTPMAFIKAGVEFTDDLHPEECQIEWEKDLYAPLYTHLIKEQTGQNPQPTAATTKERT